MPLSGALRRTLRAALPAAVLLGVGLLAPPATAHTELVAANPADGDVLGEPPQELTLTFNEEVSSEFSTVVLAVDGGEPRRLEVSGASGGVLLAEIGPDPGDGAKWRVDYRVTSADGHPVEGFVEFKVEAAAGTAPSPAGEERTPPGHAAENAGDDAGSRGSGWAFLSGPAAVLGLLLMLATLLGLARVMSGSLARSSPPAEDATPDPSEQDPTAEQDSTGRPATWTSDTET